MVGQNPPPDITPAILRDDDGTLIHNLTIKAHPEYNGTEVVCEAIFNTTGSNKSPPVTLTVQGIHVNEVVTA